MGITGKPILALEAVRDLFHESYGMRSVSAKVLPGERDLNVCLKMADGRRFVCKVCSPEEEDVRLAQQRVAMERCRDCWFVPRELETKQGEGLVEVTYRSQRYRIRCLEYLSGEPLAELARPSDHLLVDLGEKLALMDERLAPMPADGLDTSFAWNLRDGVEQVRTHLSLVPTRELRELLAMVADRAEEAIRSCATELPQAVIHNDANDYNILVSRELDETGERKISGLIDFGDLSYSFRIAELAIAAAYIVCRRQDHLSAVTHLVQGYHRLQPLAAAELECLWPMMLLRMAVSIVMSFYQQGERPDDPYLSISRAPMLAALPKVAAQNDRWVTARLRDMCSMGPDAGSMSLAAWLAEPTVEFFPVMGIPLSEVETPVVKLDGEHAPEGNPEAELSVSDLHSPGGYAIGLYEEPRLIYQSPLFAINPEEGGGQRTIHLGIDVFAEKGHVVYAPLDGIVVAAAFRPERQDYGGLLILRHQPVEGPEFFSLYGHLDRESVAAWSVGQVIPRGGSLGRLGGADENGGWPPHLHLQVASDLLGTGDGLPGVAAANEQSVWTGFCPHPAPLLGCSADLARDSRWKPSRAPMRSREQHFCKAQSLSYRKPIEMVRGYAQYLYDHTGRRYLDAYNNVPHVGHCHPHVVDAAARQMSKLNTNSRYLQGVVGSYVERITSYCPDGLEVCFLLNSASEANELAIRLARQYTGRKAIVVQEAGYHGHSTTLIDASPYKHAGPGGSGPPPWIHVLPLPDPFRGIFRDDYEGRQFALQAKQAITDWSQSDLPPAAVLLETWPSVGGQIVSPSAYLPAVYDAIRAQGGVAIADEVQTGFGRLGDCFWAFERYGVAPDIVVLGKPMGNGYPLAAVVTTRAIADAFENGMEFFSTFGGNSVSAAVGHAVLDVLEDEALPAHAKSVGASFKHEMDELNRTFFCIGEVRGAGLFWGIELVRDSNSRKPWPELADRIVNRLREQGVLIGTDGIDHNVLKIRPPMPFDGSNAQQLVSLLEATIAAECPTAAD